MRFGPESIPPDAPYLVTRGYVMYGSDSGHQGGSTWPLNNESFLNYGYEQLKKTHDAALALTVAAYGMQPPLLVATVGTTSFNSLTFRPEDFQAGVQYVMATINATNPDLSQFAAHGGKLLLKSNTSDYAAGARIPTQYYESVVAKMGQSTVDQFMRYYELVGAWHNRNVGTNTVTGATVPYYVDFIALVDNWVEDGQVPPDNITATFQDGVPPFIVRSSQPMCRYPRYPLYLGIGDTTNAASFMCAAPSDVNGDNVGSCADVDAVRALIGTRAGQAGFSTSADIDDNGVIDQMDVKLIKYQLLLANLYCS